MIGVISGINNRVRTLETHLLFELTKRNTGFCENKKSGKLSRKEMDSAFGGPKCPYFELFESKFLSYLFTFFSNNFFKFFNSKLISI